MSVFGSETSSLCPVTKEVGEEVSWPMAGSILQNRSPAELPR